LAYAAPAGGGGLVYISRQTASSSATIDFDSVFTSTYNSYLCIIEDLTGSTNANLNLQYKYSTNTIQTTGYYSFVTQTNYNGSASNQGVNNGSAINILYGALSANFSSATMLMTPGNVNGQLGISGTGYAANVVGNANFGGANSNSQTYTGFRLSPSTGNLTGSVTLYGLAKS